MSSWKFWGMADSGLMPVVGELKALCPDSLLSAKGEAQICVSPPPRSLVMVSDGRRLHDATWMCLAMIVIQLSTLQRLD